MKLSIEYFWSFVFFKCLFVNAKPPPLIPRANKNIYMSNKDSFSRMYLYPLFKNLMVPMSWQSKEEVFLLKQRKSPFQLSDFVHNGVAET